MATSRFHFYQLYDSSSIKPFKHPETSRAKTLSTDEILALYPRASVTKLPAGEKLRKSANRKAHEVAVSKFLWDGNGGRDQRSLRSFLKSTQPKPPCRFGKPAQLTSPVRFAPAPREIAAYNTPKIAWKQK